MIRVLSDRTVLIATPGLRNPDSLLVGSRISIPRGNSCCTFSSCSRTSSTRGKSSSEHTEQPTGTALLSLLIDTVRVKYGDTLADIAYGHGLSSEELQLLNNLRDENIFEGDVLAVSAASAGQSFKDFPENRSGQRRTNRLLFSRQCVGFQRTLGVGGPEQTLKQQLTAGSLKLEGRWKRKRKGFQHAQDKWMRFSSPVTEGFLSSTYGWRWGAFHEVVDVAADQGTPVLASDKGTVTFAGWSGGYGYLVAIQHEGGFVTRYAHCCAIHSRVGQQVVKRQQIAAVGATRRATGPHLHFEVRKNGEALDPLKWAKM